MIKTHELASALSVLARSLRALPDMEIGKISQLSTVSPALSSESMAMGLTTLVALADIDKLQWKNFISENNFPIEVRPKDSSRDILGRVLTYLQTNKEARNKLAHSSRNERSNISPELQRALQVLLKS